MSLTDVSEIIHAHDLAKDGKISFAEFTQIFQFQAKVAPLDLDLANDEVAQVEIADNGGPSQEN